MTDNKPTNAAIERMCVKLFGCTSEELNPDDRADARLDACTALEDLTGLLISGSDRS